MRLDGRLSRVCGPALIVGSILFFLFYGPSVGGLELGDQYWMLTLSIHGISIVALILGLIGAHAALDLDGWQSRVWWLSTAMAFLGLTIANIFFGVAVLGLAIVAISFRSLSNGAMMSVGGVLWIYLYLLGVRVGDQNARAPTGNEEALGVIAVVLMSLGLIGLGLLATRRVRRSREHPEGV